MKANSATYLFAFAGIVIIGLVGFVVFRNSIGGSNLEGFAQCLTDNGVKEYGAWWCPNCERQKAKFGATFSNIDYIECSPGRTRNMSAQCQQAGIKEFPTWRFADGTELTGDQPLGVLADKSGCELPPV